MAIDPSLLSAICAKAGIAERTAYRRIAARAQLEVWSHELAAAAVALDEGVPLRTVRKSVSSEELAEIRKSRNGNPAANPGTSNDTQRAVLPGPPRAKSVAKKNDRAARRSTKTVFVVHGRDEPLRKSVFAFLRAIGLTPREWNTIMKDADEGSPFIGQVVTDEIQKAGAIVVLLTPDDEARLREPYRGPNDGSHEKELTGQSRPNVLFEAGIAYGVDPTRTVIVQVGPHRPISDLAGRHLLHLDDSPAKRHEFVTRLKGLGLDVDDSGRDWHDTGRFELAHPVGL